VRQTSRCPKCQAEDILFVPQLADRDDQLNVKPMVVHVVEYDWRDDMEFGRIQAYICRKSGFTELYTKGAEHLPADKIPGARILRPKA
jgi:predicted nucleic-acid-binding Zn-ribbon protein